MENEVIFGTVEAVKTVSDLFMPVAGKVTAVNPDLADDPAAVNNDPYGKGWMVKVEMSDPSAAEGLLTAEQYEALL